MNGLNSVYFHCIALKLIYICLFYIWIHSKNILYVCFFQTETLSLKEMHFLSKRKKSNVYLLKKCKFKVLSFICTWMIHKIPLVSPKMNKNIIHDLYCINKIQFLYSLKYNSKLLFKMSNYFAAYMSPDNSLSIHWKIL